MKKTAEEIVQDFLFKDKPKRSYCHKRDVKDWVNLLESFGKQKWNEGCEKILSNIAITFIDEKNINKADRESDKDVFLAIGQTIKNFPKPEYEQVRWQAIEANDGGMVRWGLETTNLSTEQKLNKHNE